MTLTSLLLCSERLLTSSLHLPCSKSLVLYSYPIDKLPCSTALIRRSAGHASSDIACGPLKIDTKSNKVFLNGTKLKLTSHEYKIIEYFLHHQEKVITRTELVEHIYDQDFDRDSNTIEVFIGRLRKKLGMNLIKTERGYGYRLSVDKE